MLRRLLALSLLPALAAAEVPSAKVLERYKQMLAANPNEGTALDRLWQAYAEQGRTSALLTEFEAEQNYSGQMILGLLLRKAGRDADAIAAFQRALTFGPKNPAPSLALGRLELAAGHGAQAVIWFEKAVTLLPDGDERKTAALMELGAAALAAADLTKATEAWERTAALSPNDLTLRHQLADTYVRNQLGARAIPHLEFIEQHGPPQERAQAWQQIGAIHQTQGDQDAAIAAIEKALAFTSPGNWLRMELESQIIRLHQRYHRTAELEAKWKKFAAENPRDLGAYLQLISLYERLGDQAGQLAWLEKLVALAPKNAEYRLRLARLLVQMDLLDRAAATYDELLGSEPRNLELVFERARIDVQQEQPQAAGERIAALLARTGHDEGVRMKALEFFQTNRLYELAEKHLQEDAASSAEEALIALANFYFTRHREPDARAVLARLVREGDAPEKRAAAQFRIAEECKAQNDFVSATQAVRAAIALKDDVRDYHFVLGELETAASHYAGAEAAFERAFALSKAPAEALEADQRLYDSLRNQKQPGEDAPQDSAPRPESAAMATSAAAQGYLLNILRGAVEKPSEERWLRVARWQQWSRNQRGAIDAAERALALNPKSIAAHDFLARLLAIDPQGLGAQQHLRDLAQIDPANRAGYLRRLGQVQLQSGPVEEALKTFRQLAQESPGDLEALNDLALAQQRAEQWTDALATLKQLHALSPATRKREAVTSLLRIYDRLALRPQAAELLLQQIDAEAETKERLTLFSDLLTHCTRHKLLDWLRTQFEQRHKLRADDYFTEVALGRVLRAQGNKAAAFEVLADAALAAPDPGAALPELIREAEELHRLESAVQLQERYVRIVPQSGPEGLQRLTELQEKSLQSEAASKTWTRLVAKFPRDPQVLEKAATFERVWGQPERTLALLRRLRALDPTNHRALAQLAELNLSDGDPAEAEQCLEQILAQTEPEKATDAVRYPAVRPDDPSRLEIAYRTTVRHRSGRPSAEALKALRTFWFEKSDEKNPRDDRQSRFEVIRDLAELVAAKGDPTSLAEWVARWRKPETGRSERLWALYFAGASGPLLDEVEKLRAAKPDDASPVNAFIWLALQTGEFDRLGTWSNDPQRTPSERDFLMIGLEQYLDEHRGPIPPGLIEKLFPDGQRANLWPAAIELAQRNHFRPAEQLGLRVLDHLTTQRATCAVELAQWQLHLGEIEAARRTLRGSLSGTGDALNSSLYAALRAHCLLLPERERAAFAQECEAKLDAKKQPVQAALTRALLAGLVGDKKAAHTQLDRLLALRAMSPGLSDERATAATRQWDFVLGTGVQFVSWQLDDLAAHLWEKALADEASIALQVQQAAPQGDSVRARVLDVRTRLTALKLMRGEPAEMDALLDDYLRSAPPDGLLPLAETLEAMGANPLAVKIDHRLWSLEPANPHALRNALTACRNAGDWITLEEILTRVVGEGHFRPNEAAHRDLVQQLADVFARRGDFERARQTLAPLIEQAPPDARILQKLAELHQRCGDASAAESTYRRLLSAIPSNIAGRLSFATWLEVQGRTMEAIDLLEHGAGNEIDGRLALLNMKANRFEETLAALERLPEADHPRVSLAVANELVARGDTERALRLLRAALGRSHDRKMAFALQSRLVELLPADTERAVAQREVRRLRQFADDETNGLANYYALMQREAPRLGLESELADDLVHAWDGGRGDVATGAAWLVWQMKHGDRAATKTWAQLSAHPTLDVAALQTALETFSGKENRALHLAVLGKLARLDPAEPQRLSAWSKALHAAGRHTDATKTARELAARAVFSAELLAPTAELFAALGEKAEALKFYRAATRLDPAGQKPELHLACARLLLAEKQFAPARAELRAVSRNPAADVVPAAFEYLRATARVDAFESELADFALSPRGWNELRLAVFSLQLEQKRLPEALRLAETYPALLAGPGAARLREAARKTQQFEAAAVALEKVFTQGTTSVAADFAGLLADWAEIELTALQEESALAHLERAHELQLGSWRIAERLARLHLERKEPPLATRTLETFLAVATDATEKAKAQQMLARIPTP